MGLTYPIKMVLNYSKWTLLFAITFFAESMAMTEQEARMEMARELIGCQPKFPVEFSELNKLQKLITPTEKQTKCLLQCAYQKLGMMGENGTFEKEAAIELAKKMSEGDPERLEKGKQLGEVCIKKSNEAVTGEDPNCDRAATMFACMIETSPKYGFKVPS